MIALRVKSNVLLFHRDRSNADELQPALGPRLGRHCQGEGGYGMTEAKGGT